MNSDDVIVRETVPLLMSHDYSVHCAMGTKISEMTVYE